MVHTTEEILKKASPIAEEFGIKRMSLFGSYARGEENEDSDVDFYIEKGRLSGLIQYFSFVNALEDALDCHVDVVTTEINDREFLDKITQEGLLVYEES